MRSLRLGSSGGVPIEVAPSGLVVTGGLALLLAVSHLPTQYPGRGVLVYLLAGLFTAVLLMASVLVHELAHAQVAQRFGVQVESITLWLLGGVAKMRGTPTRAGPTALVALAGPLASLGIALVVGITAGAAFLVMGAGVSVYTLAYLSAANALLAVFNLIPAAPLDGGRVLSALLWKVTGDASKGRAVAARIGKYLGALLLTVGALQMGFLRSFSGLWLVLLGVFMAYAASAEERREQLARELRGVRVRDVMTPAPITARPDEDLARFVEMVLQGRPRPLYPLVDAQGELSGVVTLEGLRAASTSTGGPRQLSEAAVPLHQVPQVRPADEAVTLLGQLLGPTDGHVVVVDEGGQLVGVVSPNDLVRAAAAQRLRSS